MRSKERLTWWQYHIGSRFGGMSAGGDGWWRYEGKCPVYGSTATGPSDCGPGQACPIPSLHVTCMATPFPLYLQLDKDKGKCSTIPLFLKDAKRCSLLYDVIHEIHTAKSYLNHLPMPLILVFLAANPTLSCFSRSRLVTIA